MEKEKSGKMKIWMYAVILFTSAFIVLLLTAVSQIKLSRNIDDYKSRLSTKDTENYEFKMNLNSALEENDKLQKKLKELEEQLLTANGSIDALKRELSDLNKMIEVQKNTHEQLYEAEKLFKEEDYVQCAGIIFENIDPTVLGKNSLIVYSTLKEKSFKLASLELYKRGYENYYKKLYPEAAEAFRRSLDFTEDEYYSDDCLYLLAYAHHHMGDKVKATEYMTSFIIKYPKSIYAQKAKEFLLVSE